MFQPVELEAEVDYRVSLWAITDQASDQFDIQAWIGSGTNPESMDIEVIPEIFPGVQEHLESAGEFTVPTTGTYYLGIYGLQHGDDTASSILAIDDIAIVEVTQPSLGTLEGTITSSLNGEAINNATIHIGTAFTATSDITGSYSVELPTGTYEITCAAADYNGAETFSVTITEGETTTQDFSLVPLVGISEDNLSLISSANIYPNPFNPETTINFSLSQNGYTELNVFNVRGQRVAQLVKTELSTGNHSIVWNGKGDDSKAMPSGIYFFTIQSGAKTKTVKGILLK